jgi:hypothetical protein
MKFFSVAAKHRGTVEDAEQSRGSQQGWEVWLKW